ncbi:MAG: PPOX class F420-dependent oxidoreductase [Lapillicoccus sp.]
MTAAQQRGDDEFIRLTTFKRDGTPVPTTVWCVADGDDLLVTTQDTTGKVKRLRHTSRVLVAPSTRRGRVADGVTDVEGTAVLVRDRPQLVRLGERLADKYGLIAKMAIRVRGLDGRNEHSIGIRITIPDALAAGPGSSPT